MSDQPSTHPIEAMLAHERWVRALARSLVLDDALTDDVVQQAWLAALRSPPRAGRGLRGWLATVVRNTARTLRRDEARRRSREQAAARPETLPSTAELVEEARVVLDRGGMHRLSVSAGEQTEITLTIPPGMIVDGIAQDPRGTPVPGAEIWLSEGRDLLLGHVVSYSAPDGTFSLRDVSGGQLGARARGFCPSELHMHGGGVGTRVFVRLILAPGGGELTGQVSDAESEPVTGAGILLSSLENWTSVSFEDGSEGMRPAKLLTHTDEEGLFRFHGVPPGRSLRARWDGLHGMERCKLRRDQRPTWISTLSAV
ncbi:MAG: sigma factor [Planctomycetota bacterium]